MKHYEICVFDNDWRVIKRETVLASDDVDAITKARASILNGWSVKVTDGDRIVGHVDRVPD